MCETCRETQAMVKGMRDAISRAQSFAHDAKSTSEATHEKVGGIQKMLETFHADDKAERTEMWKQINSLRSFRAWASGAWFAFTLAAGLTAWAISQ